MLVLFHDSLAYLVSFNTVWGVLPADSICFLQTCYHVIHSYVHSLFNFFPFLILIHNAAVSIFKGKSLCFLGINISLG